MAFNKFMHPRNPYKERPPDFKELAKNYSVFKDHCTIDHHGKARVNFGDPEAVRALTWTLLKNDFNLDVDLPADCLVPRVTQRLNYLLWLEDLVNQNDIKGPIIGIDIGTGASCVFPLLGARQCGWDFVATDTDAKAVEVATRNVRRNQLEQHITVLAVPEGTALKGVVNAPPGRHFAFCMCNPPFFERDERDDKFVDKDGALVNEGVGSGGRRNRKRPHSATVARNNELCAEGGEVAVVNQIIDDSVQLQRSIQIYTSMIGKKSSLAPLKAKLAQIDGLTFSVMTFCQGKTQRWALAWTFHDNMRLQVADSFIAMSKEAKQTAQVYELSLPAASTRLALDRSEADMCVAMFKELMESLQIVCTECDTTDGRPSRKFICTAEVNTWTHQRKKRRAMERLNQAKYLRDAGETQCKDAGVSVQLGSGDGRDSLSNSGNATSISREKLADGSGWNVAVQTYVPTMANLSDAAPEEPLVRFLATVAPWGRPLVELQFDGGRCRDALHQIVLFCRNALSATASLSQPR